MERFPIISIETETEVPETLGTKEKFWIDHEGSLKLLKFGREGTAEDLAEKVACELCELLHIPHAHYDFALFRGRRCVLSPSIIEVDGRLIHGNELINQTRPNYDATRTYMQKEHTVSRVMAALATFTRPNYMQTWHQFLGYLMLDAWIGNTDRHHENWGLIIKKDRSVILAPTYDHASSMGRELTDEVRGARLTTRDERYSVGAFAAKARSAIYVEPSDSRPLTTFDAFYYAARAHPESGNNWLARLKSIPDQSIKDIFDKLPPSFGTEECKKFAFQLLLVNKSRLLNKSC